MCLFKCGLVGRSPSVSCLHLSLVSKEQDVICQAALAFYILPSCQLSFSVVCRVKLCSSSCKTLTSNAESFILDGESGQLARIYMCNDNLCALYVKDCNVLLLHNNLIASFKSPSCCFNSCCCSLRTRTFWCYFVCLHRLFFNIGLSHYTEIMVFVIIF